MSSTVFCIDFDETLLNTDRLRAAMEDEIRQLGGDTLAAAYVDAYETTRQNHGVPRIPLVLKTLAEQTTMEYTAHRQLADLFHNYPYQDYLYPGAEQTITHLKKYGTVLLLSDGDSFFQSQKIYRTTVASLVDSIIISPSKIQHFDDVAGYWPAERYVFIDDKQKVLDAAKDYFGQKATTVLVRQGRYVDTTQTSSADYSAATIAKVANLSPLS